MKYEKGSPMDKIMSKFPVRYVFYMLMVWLLMIAGLIYIGVK